MNNIAIGEEEKLCRFKGNNNTKADIEVIQRWTCKGNVGDVKSTKTTESIVLTKPKTVLRRLLKTIKKEKK